MKRLAVFAVLLLMMCMGGTAYAEPEYSTIYVPASDSVSNINQVNYQTVIIKDDRDNIVYVNQAASGERFSHAAGFLLMYNSGNSTNEGKYTITLGGKDGNTKTANFVIGVGENTAGAMIDSDMDVELRSMGVNTVTDSEGNTYYNMGFATSEEGVEVRNGFTILVKIEDTVMEYPEENYTAVTSGTVKLGMQINKLNEAQKNSIKVYLRKNAAVDSREVLTGE